MLWSFNSLQSRTPWQCCSPNQCRGCQLLQQMCQLQNSPVMTSPFETLDSCPSCCTILRNIPSVPRPCNSTTWMLVSQRHGGGCLFINHCQMACCPSTETHRLINAFQWQGLHIISCNICIYIYIYIYSMYTCRMFMIPLGSNRSSSNTCRYAGMISPSITGCHHHPAFCWGIPEICWQTKRTKDSRKWCRHAKMGHEGQQTRSGKGTRIYISWDGPNTHTSWKQSSKHAKQPRTWTHELFILNITQGFLPA